MLALVVVGEDGETHQNLRGTLDVEHATAEDVRLNYRSHVLVFRRKRQPVDDSCPLSNCLIVNALGVEPQQKGALGGVTDGLWVGRVGEVEISGCVHGNHLGKERGGLRR